MTERHVEDALVRRSDDPVDALQLPSIDSTSALQAELAAANERGRRDSLAVLDKLLPAVPLAELAQTSDGNVLAGSCSASGDLRQWVHGPELLDRLLGSHDIGTGRVRLVRDKIDLPIEPVVEATHPELGLSARLSGAPLVHRLADGATLVMNAIDLQDRALMRFTEHMERIYGCAVNINGYLSLRPEPGFDAHWDDHEVFIIQLIGMKEWEVHEPPVLSPNRLVVAPETTGRVTWKGVVGPGGVLHVPRGWGHDARSTDQVSFHLTVGVSRFSNLSLIDRLLTRLPAEAASRELIVDLLDASPSEWRPRLRDLVDALTPDDAVAWSLASVRGTIRGRATQSARRLLAVLQDRSDPSGVWVRSPFGGGVVVGRDEPGRTMLLFGGIEASVDDRALGVLAPRLDGRARCLADLDALGPDTDLARAAVRGALRVGLLEVVDDPGAWGVVVDRAV